MSTARTMWMMFEPIHAVTYFTPEGRAAFEDAGLRGFWRGYFAGRCAPLGAVDAPPVIAGFFGFAPAMVTRALPDIWTRISPAGALTARAAGSRAALARLLSEISPAAVEEAAELLRRAVAEAEIAGRPLAAANQVLPWPDDPLDVLWQAATFLREHRGDGHVAALLVAGLDGCESLVWRSSLDNYRDVLQPIRGWTDDEWADAARRLTERGWLDPDGADANGRTPHATAAAEAARDHVEATTDTLASGPWDALGAESCARLLELLRPIAVAASTALPYPNPVGLPKLQ